jgi:septal ring factor EnvC (AmiA/AmiB activator)
VRIPTQKGIYHKVKTGETLWRIAKTYNVGIREIVDANKIPDVAKIEKDQLVFIPGASVAREVEAVSNITPKAATFDWPIKGKILSYFGDRKDAWVNRGVDIEISTGEKITASREGKVVFADYLNGYNNTIILDHGDNFFTVYAQNSKLLVKLGDDVVQGDAIAECGKSGELAFLHFEIRKNSIADNPLYYLP